MFRLFDTAKGQVVDIAPRVPGQFSMYICGPTVYDLAHLGHGRYALVFDVLRRYLEWRGLSVIHVSNITDVDDKILDRAEQERRSPAEVASEFEEKWFHTMDLLGVLRPHSAPHATQYIVSMIDAIKDMLDKGSAYVGDDGVYFDTSAVPDYGLLARQSMESLKAGARVEAKPFKRSSTDFVLWKFLPESQWAWESPWGIGRPGWHTECVVMAVDLLGREFDLHGGGLDLSFPHHENERAQACVLEYGFAQHWVHNGFVMVGQDKMSKSLGNFTTLDELLQDTDPRAYRLLVLQSHYRSPLEVNPRTISEAARAISRLENVFQRLAQMGIEIEGVDSDVDRVQAFVRAMDDDLDTPLATSQLFEIRSQINQYLDRNLLKAAATLGATLNQLLGSLGMSISGNATFDRSVEVEDLLAARAAARAAKDFAASDRIRDDLLRLGYIVEDTAGGQKLRER